MRNYYDNSDGRQVHTTNVVNTTVNHIHYHHRGSGQYGGHGCGKRHSNGRTQRGKSGRHDRKPELYRFFTSCGLLDQDKVMRMSDSELIAGFAEMGVYTAKGFVDDVCKVGKSVVDAASAVGECAIGIADGVVGFVASLFD